MKWTYILLMLCFFVAVSCKTPKIISVPPPPKPPQVVDTLVVTPPGPDTIKTRISMAKTDAFLENLLQSHPAYFDQVMANRDSLRVQVIYTQIDRQANNEPVFKSYYFNVDSTSYFYPASTVKMPVALLALQRLNELKVFGLNSNSSMIHETAFSAQTAVFNDATSPDGRPSIAQYIKKIFLVSDNDAFNRLYEFLGQQYINEQLHKKGYVTAEIRHRLSIAMSEDENRHTNPVNFYSPEGKIIYGQPMQVSSFNFSMRSDLVGKGYYNDGRLVNEPLNFSSKNRLNLQDLTGLLRSILFPNAVPVNRRFNLRPEDYAFVWKYMSQFPSETLSPSLDSAEYPDAYVKFLLFGAEKGKVPGNIRVFNKVGDAYGFLTDAAYIVDFDKNIEFMLSATIYCNKDNILNDDKYDYDTIGLPFMKHLGEVIHDYEIQRPRAFQPDLSAFRLRYDK